ncbi:unnamed protein product [Vitrella brassicaformis CCMP3155]|uniref:Uncharacterized protein n=2 Tax=Vitrella brassicaformis TaxID=1169539 RepID=A0A0G4FXQ8_VITBC|nr:unnamed protein product [Vitrella brassicaformis CCMP3155]|mmetsp:Transcript_14304/g.34109  ORF Transcript_14304/g.34109 Transcript_14304/m.34109 type:complete len:251 (+) Transcript_14304:138-890(+)|eukprot:CEM20202.1 unnamed protein product [Vitrella brassicaformis CCMP3155]
MATTENVMAEDIRLRKMDSGLDIEEGRALINSPLNIVVFDRPHDPQMTAFLRDISQNTLQGSFPYILKRGMKAENVAAEVKQEFAKMGVKNEIVHGDLMRRFAADVQESCLYMSLLTRNEEVVVSLVRVDHQNHGRMTKSSVTNNSFHINYDTIRLTTTYVGNGIEYVPENFLQRFKDGSIKFNRDTKIEKVGEQKVVVLKGNAFDPDSAEGVGVVHRYPKLNADDPKDFQIILKVDPVVKREGEKFIMF